MYYYILHSKDQKKALYGLWRAKMTLTNNANTWYVFPTIVKNKHLGTYLLGILYIYPM